MANDKGNNGSSSQEQMKDILQGYSSAAALAEKMKMSKTRSASKFCEHFADIFADCNKHKRLSCGEYSRLMWRCGEIEVEETPTKKGREKVAEDLSKFFGLILTGYGGCEQEAKESNPVKQRIKACQEKYAAIMEKIVSIDV